jgi:hypothetical protein
MFPVKDASEIFLEKIKFFILHSVLQLGAELMLGCASRITDVQSVRYPVQDSVLENRFTCHKALHCFVTSSTSGFQVKLPERCMLEYLLLKQ